MTSADASTTIRLCAVRGKVGRIAGAQTFHAVVGRNPLVQSMQFSTPCTVNPEWRMKLSLATGVSSARRT